MSAEKAEAFSALLTGGNILLTVMVDNDGVILPEFLKARSQHATVERNGTLHPIRLLHLEYGYQMAKPIPDLKIDEAGISATLSFDQSPHLTFVPWSAMAFARYLPADGGALVTDAAPSSAPSKKKVERRHLYAVAPSAAFDPSLQLDDQTAANADLGYETETPFLRLVK